MISSDAYIAANRFGLGSRRKDLADIASDPRGWLRAQLTAPPSTPVQLSDFADSASNVIKFFTAQRSGAAEIQKLFRTEYKEIFFREVSARTMAMMNSDTPFRERLVMFWSNHFTVSATRPIVAGLAGAYEREAIRPNITGRFADLLVAVVKHPAMILYLDNALSIGPSSPAGRFLDRGLNENLAREILELHTLGVNGGYTQHDVLALAKLITGWSLARPRRQPNPGHFHFHPRAHEPGAKVLLGKTYAQGGIEEGETALRDIARHPSTARHIAFKFVRHFVTDNPPDALVTHFANIFTETDGDLLAMSEALIERPEPWQDPQAKYKTPYEFVLSTLRATGFGGNARQLLGTFNELGQIPFTAPSPAGWPDVADAWAGPEAVVRRAEVVLGGCATDSRECKSAATDGDDVGTTRLDTNPHSRRTSRKPGTRHSSSIGQPRVSKAMTMTRFPLSRRQVLQSSVAFAATGVLDGIGQSAKAGSDERRLVVVFLRGGLDGLAAAPAHGDPAYRKARGDLAIGAAGATNEIIDLDGFFGLHPTLAPLLPFYRQGEMLVVHALASTHRGRSHFDAQNLIENGTTIPYGAADGWLNRALGTLMSGDRKLGLAVGGGVPLLIRGSTPIATWSPTILPAADSGFLMQLADLYSEDSLLGAALAEGTKAQIAASGMMDGKRGGGSGARRGLKAFQVNARAAGELLAAPGGPRVAVLELGGWDTHASQGTTDGRLNYFLEALAQSLVTLRTSLADAWHSSAILVLTEFGRTVAPNGTGGTDHGTAGAAFLLGGAVAGGRVVADWPGLANDQLFEGRDLKPTLETRALFKGLLRDQLGVAEAAIEDRVFPKSRDVAMLDGLIRG